MCVVIGAKPQNIWHCDSSATCEKKNDEIAMEKYICLLFFSLHLSWSIWSTSKTSENFQEANSAAYVKWDAQKPNDAKRWKGFEFTQYLWKNELYITADWVQMSCTSINPLPACVIILCLSAGWYNCPGLKIHINSFTDSNWHYCFWYAPNGQHVIFSPKHRSKSINPNVIIIKKNI